MKFRMRNKHNLLSWVLLLILAVQFLNLLFRTIPAYRSADEAGEMLGTAEGRKAGMYLGSVQGTREGIEESEKRGLSTDELSSKLSEILDTAGRIQILSAAVGTDWFLSPEEVNQTGTTAVFTVDLSQASVKVSGEKTITVTIPFPECTAYDTDQGVEIANGADSIPSSFEKEARRLAISHTEELADIVCGQICSCTVSFSDSEGGDINE